MRVVSMASGRVMVGRIIVKRRASIDSLLRGTVQQYSRLVLTEKLFRAKLVTRDAIESSIIP
jgi:hypothetical protein